jgi:hypothetical protein
MESGPQPEQMTAIGYISDKDVIVKASCSLLQYDSAAGFQLSARSRLPPALPAKNLHQQNVF